MNKYLIVVLLLVALFGANAQQSFNYFYNQDIKFDSNIPTPKDVLGFEVGDWHVTTIN